MDVWELNPERWNGLAEGLCDMGEGIILAEDLHDWVEDILFTTLSE
jgi:hypothetical protein